MLQAQSYETGFNAAEFQKTVDAAKAIKAELAELTAKAGKGDRDAAIALLQKEIDLNRIGAADAKKKVVELKIDGEARKAIDSKLAKAEVMEIVGQIKGPDDMAKAGEALAVMLQEGRVPPEGQEQFYMWQVLFRHGQTTKNAELLGKVLAGVEGMSRKNQRFIDMIKKTIEEVQAGGDKKEEGKDGK